MLIRQRLNFCARSQERWTPGAISVRLNSRSPFLLQLCALQRKELLQRESGRADGEGIFHPHIAPVPGLVYHAGGGLPLLRPAEDKTILRSVGVQPLVGAGISKAGGLFGAVRAEDVRRIAGGLLAGIGRRLAA